MSARLRGFLDNPLSGLAPWIVMAVMSGIVPFEVAIGLSLATALAILAANAATGGSQKALEYFRRRLLPAAGDRGTVRERGRAGVAGGVGGPGGSRPGP